MATDSIQVSALIPASPQAIYDAWLDSDLHTKMTGAVASIDATVGGKHSAWGSYITGETIALDPGKSLSQTWLAQDFPEGSGSSKVVVRFDAEGEHTRVVVDHTELPEGHGARFVEGWQQFYFRPMLAFFGGAREKPGVKKTAPKRAAAKKVAAKKAPAKKVAAKKVAAKKVAAKKPAAKKAVAKKAAPKKPAAKKTTTSKSGAKKSAK